MKPILVHCHIYYPELWPELKECIANISPYPFELYVTLVGENLILKQDIERNYPKSHIQIIENRGYDVGSFVSIINEINLDNFSYVIKLHTKRNMVYGASLNYFDISGSRWRDYLLSFIKTKEVIHSIIDTLEKKQELGCVANYHLITERETDDLEVQKSAVKLIEQQGFHLKNYVFVAGTMFIMRAALLAPLKNLGLTFSDFEKPCPEHSRSLAHIIERFLGYMIIAQQSTIKDTFSEKQYSGSFYVFLRRLKRFLFRSKINKKGKLRIKVCNIPLPTFF